MTLRKVFVLLGLTLLSLSMTAGPCNGPRPIVFSFSEVVGQKQPEWSPDGSIIVFAYGKDLYSVTSDGTKLDLITSEKEQILSPVISPDGLQIAYTSLRKGPFWSPGEHREIRIVGIDGSSKRTLGRNGIKGRDQPYDINPAWSPDGKSIAFVSNRPKHSQDSPYHVYVMEQDGSDVRRLTSSVTAATARPNWSPDGKQLAFVGGKEDFPTNQQEYAYVAHVDGGGLTNLGRTYTPPEWSPDGRRLAFISTDGPRYLLVLATPDGSVHPEVSKVPASFGLNRRPALMAWFPNARKLILTTHNKIRRYGMYIVDLTRPDPSGEGFQTSWFQGGIPSWSPDGTMIATYHRGNPFLYTMLPDRSHINPLVAKGQDGPVTGSEWREFKKTKTALTPNP